MRRLLTSALVLLALLATGCGGSGGGSASDAKNYQHELNATSAALKRTFSDVGTGISRGGSLTALARSLDRGAQALDEAARAFAKIAPPDKAKAGHAELVAGLRELSDAFSASARATRGGDARKIAAAIQAVQGSAGTRKITDAEKKLHEAGFTLPGGSPGSG